METFKDNYIVQPLSPKMLASLLTHEELTSMIREGLEKLKERNKENVRTHEVLDRRR